MEENVIYLTMHVWRKKKTEAPFLCPPVVEKEKDTREFTCSCKKKKEKKKRRAP